MTQEIMNLFAVPVIKYGIGRNFTEAELKSFAEEMKDAVPALSNHASRNKNVLASEAMSGIRSIIQDSLDNYFRTVFNTANDVQLKITQSWKMGHLILPIIPWRLRKSSTRPGEPMLALRSPEPHGPGVIQITTT